jgi:pyridinium-3,5-bisthiocarboxylic acid mononucleotide nickel chelatase
VSKLLYFDCFAGASGDMILGALLDAGLPLDALRGALGSLAIDGYELAAERVRRAGVSATKFRLIESGSAESGHTHAQAEPHAREPEPAHVRQTEHGHSHDHPHAHAHAPEHVRSHAHDEHGHAHQHEHAHRSLSAIEAIIARSALSPAARDRATMLFRRLAEAEAAIHDMPVEQVHLHEVGALDSIIDIVGAVFALDWFGADRIVCSPLNTGSGMVRCAHGHFPVPAPATARLIAAAHAPAYASGPGVELLTPTGALLTTGYAESYGPLPAMTIDRIGYGAGDRDFADFPNVLRVFVGSSATDAAEATSTERVIMLECEIDDMNPQIYGVLMDRLLAAGALDVYYAPVQMKKNRPGTLVTIVAPPDLRPALTQIIFRETTTLGLRYHEVFRECLARERVSVPTPWGTVRIKVARQGDAIMNAAPEFDDCVRLATEHRRAVKEVQAAAMQAFWQQPRS